MRFEFIISETENLFFFISNLADWHFSCRSDYNAAWLEISGSLTKSEGEILKTFRDLMKKHGFTYKNNRSLYLGRAFFIPQENKKWLTVESMLDKNEIALVQNIFKIFKPRFKKVWHVKQLRRWERVLNKRLKDEKIQGIFSGIEKFLGAVGHQVVAVHLISSPSIRRAVSGGANLGRGHLTLEVPIFKMNNWNAGNAIAIMAHESAHTIVDGKYVQGLLDAFLKGNKSIIPSAVLHGRSRVELLHELISDVCAPYGYFCSGTLGFYEPATDVLFGGLGNIKGDYGNFSKNVVWGMYPIVAEYVAQKKRIDARFLKKLATVVKTLTS